MITLKILIYDKKYKKKNIILPDFNDRHLEKSKTYLKYIIYLDELNHIEFSRCFSNKSKIKKF